jgi:rhodanese-related sulfurtransferase
MIMFNGMKDIHWLTACLCGLLLAGNPAEASHESTDMALTVDHIDGVTTVDATALIELAQSHPDLRIIDARLHSDRRYGYIEGSVNLPDVDTDCDSLRRIVPEPQTPIAFYCNGPKCLRSAHAVRIAQDCGYQHLFWYRGGIEAWTSEDFPVFRD